MSTDTGVQIERFLCLPEQKAIERRWTANDIIKLRNPVEAAEYPVSNMQALKLRELLAQHTMAKTTSFTYGAADPIMAHEMGEAGFDTLYCSGANATLTETMDCGGDLADYTYDTLPKKVKQLVNNQLHWARVDQVRGTTGRDRLVPIVADADSGHGNSTATMKMVKLFLEAGVAAIHLDDLLSGEKNFSVGSLTHVVVPSSEHIRRLLAAKLQLDICASHVVLVGRTDSESASRITSNIDPTDRPFILGATESSSRSLLQYLGDQVLTGAPLVEAETAWESKAKLMTLDEAIQAQAPNQYDTWKRKTRGLNTSEAYSVAQQSGLSVFWSADACRNNRGWYRYRGGIDAAISRSITFAKHVDLVWSCAPGYNWDTVCRYEKEVHAAYPNKWLGYNWSFGLFEGESEKEIAGHVRKVGELGYVWQFNPQAGFYASGVAMHHFAEKMHKDHLLPYTEMLKEGEEHKVSIVDWYEQAGDLTDALTDLVA